MSKDKMVLKLMKMAGEITGKNTEKYTWEKYRKLWDMCYDWNSEHPDCEIFMCDMSKADGDEHDGFYIEDDYFIFED